MYLVGKLNSEAFLGIRVDHSIGNKSPWGWPGINHRPSLHTYFYWNGVGGNGQKSPSSKTAVLLAASRRARPLLTRGAYSLYVSTTKWRERCWRLFSTFPPEEVRSAGRVTESEIRRNRGKISFWFYAFAVRASTVSSEEGSESGHCCRYSCLRSIKR